MSKVQVYFHNHCFDGSASAAVFTALYRKARGEAEFSYLGLTHKATDLFSEAPFAGDDNAIVDFKYSPDPRVTWWFDHHQSAFLRPEDAGHFAAHPSGQKFYDPAYGSCTQFIADVGRNHFGFDPTPLEELIHWADIIDQAHFPSAQAAVELKEPALKLTLAIEGSTSPEFLPRLIPDFLRSSLSELLERDYVRRELDPLLQRHLASIDMFRSRLHCEDGVVFYDVADLDQEGYNKFIPYYHHSESIYCVGVSRSQYRMKVSVGVNPWNQPARAVNLAQMCERYGGGGHPYVGAISYAREQVAEARATAAEVIAELQAAVRADVSGQRRTHARG